MARIAIDASAQDPIPTATHNLDLGQRVKTLEDLARSYANGDLLPGTEYALVLDFADAAGAATNFVMPVALCVLSATITNNGANGANANTVLVGKAATAITEAMALNGKAAGDIVRNLVRIVAAAEFAAGDSLRVTTVRVGGVLAFQLVITVVFR